MVETASSGTEALGAAAKMQPDLMLVDVHMPGISGLTFVKQLPASLKAVPTVMMTADTNIRVAVRSMQAGAVDFITKPVELTTFVSTIGAILDAKRPQTTVRWRALVGESEQLEAARKLAQTFAVPDINIVLEGETGTGKELFARLIHTSSKRRAKPFVAVDCSTLAESLFESELFGHEKGAFTGAAGRRIGHFEAAQGGTIFLDEITNLPVRLQAKLLRVIQEKQVKRVGGVHAIPLDIRIVSATNVDLRQAMKGEHFREDLFYRLNETSIRIPPLRARVGDVAILARHFSEVYAKRYGGEAPDISTQAQAMLDAYPWPGNVRELENAIKAAAVLADGQIETFHLPEVVRGISGDRLDLEQNASELLVRLRIPLQESLDLKALTGLAIEEVERAVLTALAGTATSRAELARRLNVDPKTLRKKLRQFGLDD